MASAAAEERPAEERRSRVLEAAELREALGGFKEGSVSAARAAEVRERRVKDELVGKLTEYHHRRREEAPIGLGSASVEQLLKLWERAQRAEAEALCPASSSSPSSSKRPSALSSRNLLEVACGALAEGDDEEARQRSTAADLEALGDLLGARCVDASQVEHAVIDRCDTAVDLQRAKADLQGALREESRLQSQRRQLAASKEAASAADGEAQLGDADERQERLVEEQLAQARAKRRRLETEVQQLQGRSKAHQCTDLASVQASSAASSSSALDWGASRSFSHLQSKGSVSAPLDLDDDLDDLDDDDEDVQCVIAAETTAGSSGAASCPSSSSSSPPPGSAPTPQRAAGLPQASPSVAASRSCELPLQQARSSGGTLSAKDYLARFQRKAAASVSASRGPLALRSSASRAASSAPPSAAKPPGAAAARTEDARRRQGGVKHESKKASPKAEKADGVRIKAEQHTAETSIVAEAEPKKYRIDVSQIVPKPAISDMNKWKQANPAEYMAMQAEGEPEVSGHQNLLKAKPFTKRKKDSVEDGSTPKARRGDDTSDSSFVRRQKLWKDSGQMPASGALNVKQQVDQQGRPTIKAPKVKDEPGSGDEEDRKAKRQLAGALQDDVQVADGLRAPRWLWEALYPYQHTCVRWLWELQGERHGGILADEMGLGKTVQISAYLGALHHSGVLQTMRVQNTSLGAACPSTTGGVLIICPATLISQWRNELHIWYPPLRVCIMHQVGEAERKEAIKVACQENGVLITSYETMRRAHEELLEATWVMMVLDEGQKIRSPDAAVTIAAKQFSTPHRIILSGSPIQNNLKELWSLFDFIHPGLLGTLPVFEQEMAQPIEAGSMVGANETQLAAAYQCALALRQLTQPCILRRTKAECMDVLQLPHKQEQVLFCHLTPEQYQVYIEFLQTDHVRRSMVANVAQDKRKLGAAFFSISVLRKLCNHPDLLLKDADEEAKPEDMWNPDRSGKMKVLTEIMRKWKAEGHRALIFVQTVQMLDVLQYWMQTMGYTHLRIDGKTPVKKRLTMIEEFNGNVDLFSMILTTRVGGVGLNIIGANRVVIFDPDWNPMTDVQARERTWRIGQRRDVTVYRLVLSGTVEEKIYQRQVYKHFLSQKILNDPRQRHFFKWNDLADLFEIPPMPPGFSPKDMMALRQKYKSLFRKLRPDEEDGVETTEVMKAISDLPSKSENKDTKDSKAEHSAILQTLYDSNGIKASFNHDKVEQPLLDRKIVREGATMIASRAVAALQRSAKERAGHHISEPTWTGHTGRAGARGRVKAEHGVVAKREQVKLEPGATRAAVARGGAAPLQGGRARFGTSSADILAGLRTLAAIRSAATQQRGPSQSAEAKRLGVVAALTDGKPGSGAKQEAGAALAIADKAADGEVAEGAVGLPTELHKSDRAIAESILGVFLNPKLAGKTFSLTTGQVLDHLASGIAPHHTELFKSLLKQMCELTRPTHPSQPGVWILRPEFRPGGAAKPGSGG